MTYIVQCKDRFYVVAYDGLDPLTGKERRRWHPVGHDRHDAELAAVRIDRDNAGAATAHGGPQHLGEELAGTWLPLKRRHVRATTAYRYSWFIDRYINPAIGDVPLRRLRADDLQRQPLPAGQDQPPAVRASTRPHRAMLARAAVISKPHRSAAPNVTAPSLGRSALSARSEW